MEKKYETYHHTKFQNPVRFHGCQALHDRNLLKTAEVDNRSYWGEFISGFFLTFSNPLILFFIIGLFARFNFILPEYIILHYIWAYLTIFGGAIIWWYLVTLLVSKLRSRFNVRSLRLVNRIVASILIAMAVVGVVLAIVDHLPK